MSKMSLVVVFLCVCYQFVFEEDIDDSESIGEAIVRLGSGGVKVFNLNVPSDREFKEQVSLSSQTLNLTVANGRKCTISYNIDDDVEEVELDLVKPAFTLNALSLLKLVGVNFTIRELPHEDHDHQHEDDKDDEDDDHEEHFAGVEHSFILIKDNSTLVLIDVLVLTYDLDHLEITAPVISVDLRSSGNFDYNGVVNLTKVNFTDIEFHEASFMVLQDSTYLFIKNCTFTAEETLHPSLKRLLGDEEEHHHDAAWLINMDEDKNLKINATFSYTTFGTVSIFEEGVYSGIEVLCLVGDGNLTSSCKFENCVFKAFTIREVDPDEQHAPTFFHFTNLLVDFTSSNVVGTYEEELDSEIESCWNDAIFYFESSVVHGEDLSFEHIQGGVFAVEDSDIYLKETEFTNVTQAASQFHTAKKAVFCVDSKIYYDSLNATESSSLWIKDENCSVFVNNDPFDVVSYLTVPVLTKVIVDSEGYIIFEGTNLVPFVCQFRIIDSEDKVLNLNEDALEYLKSNQTHIVFNKPTTIPEDLTGWSAEVGYVKSGWCDSESPNYSQKTAKVQFVPSSNSGKNVLCWKEVSEIFLEKM